MRKVLFWLLLAIDRLSLWIEDMTNAYYNHSSGVPATQSRGSSLNIRAEFDLVEDGFDAVETALNLKAPKANPTFTGTTTVATLAASADATVNGVIIGRSGGNVATNTAVGSASLDSNTSGNNNTAVGVNSLTANTTGSQNVAVGVGALGGNIDGGNNVAIGQASLSVASSGAGNTAVGQGAGLAISTGSLNTALGYGALLASSTADSNTALGSNTLISSTGANNTAVGAQAGYGAADINANASGANNTFIGYRAVGASATASNVITLGNSSIATLRCQVTSITSLSDARDKTAISDLSFGLDFIASLRPVAFTWNTRDGAKVGIRSSGFIAQELKAAQESWGASEVLRLVYEENPEKLEASYGHLIPVLVKALQELNAEVDSLRAQLIG